WTRSTPACAAALSPTTSRSRPTAGPSRKPDPTTPDRRRSRENRNPPWKNSRPPPSGCSATSRPRWSSSPTTSCSGTSGSAPACPPRDRSLVTVAVLAATYRPDQLTSHLRRALANGLTQDELVEALTHLAFY